MEPSELMSRAGALYPYLVEFRRDLHRHPELSGHEQRTADKVAAELTRLGLSPQRGVGGGHGVVADLLGDQPGPTWLLRADMDGLPITETTDAPYASLNPGVMHACGHDGHTTCLVGAAHLLTACKSQLKGKVRFCFQPHEEMPPGGALAMIGQGVLDGVDRALALHVHPAIPVGQAAFRSGVILAYSSRFTLAIHGVGGHAGRPHQAVDAGAAAVQVYQAFQYLVSRENDPLHPFVISIGKINGGTAPNVIPVEVILEGTVRCLDPDVALEIPHKMERVIKGVCDATRTRYSFEYHEGYPALVNNPDLTRQAMDSTRLLLGAAAVNELSGPEMGGEDFAYFARLVPACFFRLGVRNEGRGFIHPLHSPGFDLDEEALPLGAAVLSHIVLDGG